MDFTFNAEQIAFRDAIRRFLMIEAAPEMLREIWETQTGRSRELRAKVADQGLTAISVPQAYGGIGLGDIDWVLVQVELGYCAIPDSLLDTAYLAAFLLSNLPAAVDLKRHWLPRIAEGTTRIAIGHPLSPLVADAQHADLLLLWNDDEVHGVAPSEVSLTFNASIDDSRRLYKVAWAADPRTRICPARIGRDLWEGVVNRASLAISAQLLGLAQRMLDLGTDYSAQRKQFGKPVGSFQAVKHQMADIAVKIEFAKPVVFRAAHAISSGSPRQSAFVSHARLATGEAALLAARNALQVHGAIGYTWEADLQMFMKRAWALEAAWGDRSFHKRRVADLVFAADSQLGPAETFN